MRAACAAVTMAVTSLLEHPGSTYGAVVEVGTWRWCTLVKSAACWCVSSFAIAASVEAALRSTALRCAHPNRGWDWDVLYLGSMIFHAHVELPKK